MVKNRIVVGDERLNLPISVLESFVSKRVMNSFIANDIKTLRGLAVRTEAELLRMRDIMRPDIRAVKRGMSHFGQSLWVARP